MGAGRKLKTHRRNQRWADKAYKKSHLGNEWKKPFAGSSHAKGIVLEKMYVGMHDMLFLPMFYVVTLICDDSIAVVLRPSSLTLPSVSVPVCSL
jgi:hypothetical protein